MNSSKKAFGKIHIHACKKAFFENYFNSGQKIIMGNNPFYIYWVAKLFEECNTNEKFTQRDMLKGLSTEYLFWGSLSQINDNAPHHGCYCFHCKLKTDCEQVLLERGYPQESPPKDENGFYFNSLTVYSECLERINEIKNIYFK